MIRTKITVRETVTENGTLDLTRFHNVVGLQNAGTATVILDSGWNLAPGEKEWYGSQTDDGEIEWKPNVQFDTATGGVRKLQVITVDKIIC